MRKSPTIPKEIFLFVKLLTILSVAGLIGTYFTIRVDDISFASTKQEDDLHFLPAEFPSSSQDVIQDEFNSGNRHSGKQWDFFIVSAYYYNTSKSLGNNSIALVLSGHWTFPVRTIELMVSNGTRTKTVQLPLVKAKENISSICKMNTYIATVETGIDNLSSIGAKSLAGHIEIPIKLPVQRKHEVVGCVSPLFTAEQWQETIFSLHIYKRFVGHPHIYIRSVVQPLYEVLKIYEKEGYTTLEPWLRYAFPTVSWTLFNPNKEVEFRAQDAAHTDCLLKYKESASFIFFVDIDDILIPKLAPTYFEEYTKMFAEQPLVKYFRYQKWNAAYKSTRNPDLFKVDRMLASLEYTKTIEIGKHLVRPEFINATWIHYPQGSARMEWRNVSVHHATITHLKSASMDDAYFSSNSPVTVPHYNLSLVEEPYWHKGHMNTTNLMSDRDFEAIAIEFVRQVSHHWWMITKKMRSLPQMEFAWHLLPTKPFYGLIVGACYKRLWYITSPVEYDRNQYICTNADKCDLPKNPGVMCVNARAKYRSIVTDGTVNFHFATDGFFKEEDGCVP